MGNIKVIRVEKVFEGLFCNLRELPGCNSLFFHYGDQRELDRFLLKKRGEKYPLLWYLMPNKTPKKEDGVVGRFRFILAQNTEADWFNDQRFEKSFEAVLFPYMEEILNAIEDSTDVSFTGDEAIYDYTTFPNYSDESSNTTSQIDFWDAIAIDIDLTVHADNDC